MKKNKKVFVSAFVFFILLTGTIVSSKATDYRLRQESSVSTSVGGATVYCTGVYYSSGNTRWNRFWEVYNPSMKSASVSSSTMTIPTDRYMNTTGKFSLTTNDYRSASGSRTLKFYFNGSKVVANN